MGILETRRIRLRPIEEKDFPILHMWRNEVEYIKMCSNRRNPVNFEKFVAELKHDSQKNRHLQLLIEIQEKNISIGTIFSFDLNFTDGYVFIAIYLTSEYQKRGYGAEAGILFLCYLFDHFPLHKIYFETFGYNRHSLSTLKTAKFIEEGRFKEHRFFEGERHDVIRFAAYRSCLTKMKKILSRFQVFK
ncbi:MAG: GNAT family protein [bacterium]|nr:GNAT family protein [bacterium]